MFNRSKDSVRVAFTISAMVFSLELACLPASAADAAAKPAATEQPSTPTITSVRCRGLKLSVAWKGSGVRIVDYLGTGDPPLQVRQDPSPTQTRTEITFGKEWAGRKVDVRIWDKDAKLFDTKSVECKAAS
jgi:hypothetical protein